MENIALTDSNDDLTGKTNITNPSFRAPPLTTHDEQQHVTSELHDAANTDVTKASFPSSINTPFRPLFPAPSTGSPLLFQQTLNNPLLQPPLAGSNFSSPLIQTGIRPPTTMASAFQAQPPSAFTPLVPPNSSSQSTSLIQPKLTIGNPSTISILPPTQPVHQPIPKIPSTQNMENIIASPPSQPSDTHFQPLPLTTMKDLNAALPPPPPLPSSSASNPSSNPYSARASLTERIYPSMPTSQAPLQPQQLPPPTNFQGPPPPSSSGGLFIPPTMPSTLSNSNSNDVPIYTPTYQAPVAEPNPVSWNTYSTPTYDQQSNEQGSNNQTGLWSWISGNKMLATVVEKAKTGIETVITTVDPQMKQYIQPGYEVHIVVTSAKDVKLTPVRDAFTHVFGRATTQGIGVQSNVAPQPVGFEAGFKGAQQRIENLRRQNVVRSDQCVVSIENFIAELVPDMFFDLGYVLLSDPFNSIELHLFTQAIPVPMEYVYQARDRTPADYPLKWSGYMVTVGEMIHSHLPYVNPEDWHEIMSGTSRRDIIYAACKSLAYMYKQRLSRKQ